jgi:hypothetical protein
LSKATDEITDFNVEFSAMDQTDSRLERAPSSFDQRHKVVMYGMFESPKKFGGLTLIPVFRANSSRPFNLLAGTDVNGDRHPENDRPPTAGRNTGIGPDFRTLDLRLARSIRLGEKSRNLELMMELFNLFNRLNYASVNNVVGPDFKPPFHVAGRKDLSPSQPLGFTSAFDPRRLQLGVRLSF